MFSQVAAQLVRQGCVSSTRELKKKKTSKGVSVCGIALYRETRTKLEVRNRNWLAILLKYRNIIINYHWLWLLHWKCTVAITLCLTNDEIGQWPTVISRHTVIERLVIELL